MNRSKLRVWLLATIAVLLPALNAPAANDEPSALKYARGFQVEPHAGCCLLTVRPSWKESGKHLRYLLVPRGKPVPPDHPPAQVIRVPVRRVVSLSTTHIGYMAAAGQIDRLVGVGGFKYINTPSVRRRIEAGHLKEVGVFTTLRLETLLELSPDLILASAAGSVYDVHPKLVEAGLPTVLMLDNEERHPLGRLEWIKFMALFFQTETHAEKTFAAAEKRYLSLADLKKNVSTRPKIITGVPFQGQWWVAKGNSFVAGLIQDAGGEYLFSEIPGGGSLPMDVEAVYSRALSADIWFNTGSWKTLGEAQEADPRFLALPALKQGRLYNNNKRLNRWGGNDYWESGMLRPDMILADLIAIMHPELLPHHQLVYYRKLGFK